MNSRANAGIASVQFTFLGTSSAVPTLRRNVTSSVLRLDGESMVFDAGEGTQHQLMRSQTRPGRIRRILLTHMHGDHSFGLPGLVTGLCGVKKDQSREEEARRAPGDKLRIYGPRGVREFLAAALRLSRMRIPADFFVHELVETAEEAAALVAGQGSGGGSPSFGYGGGGGGGGGGGPPALHDPSEPACHTVVAPTMDGEGRKTWHLFDGPVFGLRAGALAHTVPCWGYVFQEREQAGTMDVERLMASPLGGKRLGPWLQALKNGQTIDGVRREDVCGPPLAGRKIVVLGDTCDPSGIAHLAERCNLLVHEATMRDAFRAKAFKRGHSTASMAAEFARTVRAEELALTHFGGEISSNSSVVFGEMAAAVKRVFGKAPIFARDFLSLQVERKRLVALPAAEGPDDVLAWNDPEEEPEEEPEKE